MRIIARPSISVVAMLTLIAIGASLVAASTQADEWTRFRGPLGHGCSAETGLLKSWPEGGPPMLWKIEGLGVGYSSVSFSGDLMFTMGDLTIDGDKSQYIEAYDLTTRERVWETKIGPPHRDGPRCTPTLDGDRVYAIGTSSDLLCVDMKTGRPIWSKNLARDFGGKMMSVWAFSESPLIDGDRLICTPGGKEATMVALDKMTGETIWKCAMPNIGSRGKDGAGYSTAVVSEACGVRQYVQILGRGAIGVEAATGRFLWGYNKIASGTANITSPVTIGDFAFVTTSYGTGSALLKLVRDGDTITAEEVYFNGPDVFENHHGGVVRIGAYIYGGNGMAKGAPVCLDLRTGKPAWKVKAPARGSAAVIYADGNMIFRYESGDVFLVEATPDEFRIKGKLNPPTGQGPAWPHPALRNGLLYLRHRDVISCYDLREK